MRQRIIHGTLAILVAALLSCNQHPDYLVHTDTSASALASGTYGCCPYEVQNANVGCSTLPNGDVRFTGLCWVQGPGIFVDGVEVHEVRPALTNCDYLLLSIRDALEMECRRVAGRQGCNSEAICDCDEPEDPGDSGGPDPDPSPEGGELHGGGDGGDDPPSIELRL